MNNGKKILILNQNDKKIKLIQRKDMFCVSLDTILLSNFIKIKPSTKVIIDFGTNNAAIPIILATKFQGKIIGIEIQKAAVDIALENVKLNALENRITVIHEDIKTYAQKEKVDLIVCNPPFFPLSDKSKVKTQPLKIPARHEVYINLEEIIASASRLLRDKGRLVIINSVERMNETLLLLKKYQITPKKLQIVYPKINHAANVFLIEAGFLAKEGMIVLPPLICHNKDNTYVAEIAKWYKTDGV
ncbi:tRNA1(Val) (adenine(37)-N6)-methyltransferase [Spiroplasma endosymbiont of Polydrusus pterygomalis]|uniref:tRNA1(Val) (adenine(37)-N6)-methyltransferase n=1 Tax=Spiroplasma endosymbiont of Polydrusus pterygomalis TaxID=3139327 RepID=UPI003CCAA45E